VTRNKRAIALAATLMLLALAPATARAAFTPGSTGVGDPFFPLQGNGGYDASSYDLDLAYQPGSQRLRATATIAAVATQDLSQFDLDYRGPTIDALSVDGAPAAFERRGQELVVTPAAGITAATGFTVEVRYHGRATNIKDPDGALDGWIHTDDGVAALGEPQGAPTWFPCNDTPTDKALYRISIRVPKRLKAISNGRLASHEPDGTWNWVSDEPMASYLATVTIGRFQVERGRAGGVPSYVAVDPREARKSRRPLRATPRIMRLFDRLFGPYPFSQVGAIVDHAQKIGYALETQTRPVYDRAPNARLIAHELAHMWFGDSVSVTTWPDIWLNEGFATWAQWRYAQTVGDASPAKRLRRLKREPASRVNLWNPPPAALRKPSQLFAASVYVRGGMALEALRERIGNEAFYSTLRTWAATHRDGNATVEDFTALAEQQSNKNLDALFGRYLYKRGKP
jgi:aminopeptidase N